jgi:3-deoxy-manno-octulosonate cytidylyltransferase (CMP-KDO synthetase)
MKIIAVIPARYNSTRFKGKPLADICGKPMIWWVYNQVLKVEEFSEIIVATDDKRIAEICEKYYMKYVVTSSELETSTERLYEVSLAEDADYYVCVNGDEPLIDPATIKAILPKEVIKEIYVANLMTNIVNPIEVVDNTNIKVVTDQDNNALYMSRSPIPYPKASMNFIYKKHLGVLVYNKLALKVFKQTPRCNLEKIEDINELRFIENGYKLKMIEVAVETLSVDTPKDLIKVISIISSRVIE